MCVCVRVCVCVYVCVRACMHVCVCVITHLPANLKCYCVCGAQLDGRLALALA